VKTYRYFLRDLNGVRDRWRGGWLSVGNWSSADWFEPSRYRPSFWYFFSRLLDFLRNPLAS